MFKQKKILALLLMCVMIFTLPGKVVTAGTLPYTDVSRNWAYSSIATCYEKGWITGTSATTFSPSDKLTRGQFVTILGRYAGANASVYKTSSFSDVDFSGWGYAPYVSWAEMHGIAHGIDKTHFKPGGVVTRAQLAVFLYNYVQYIGADLKVVNKNVSFKDEASIPAYAKTAVKALAQAGVISGSNGSFNPGEACTREMVAAFLVKFDKALSNAACTRTFTINENSTPYNTNYKYTANTRFYYNMRAALEQLERVGGGTITVEAGDYVLSGILYVPSNTEIILNDGVSITKTDNLGVMFAFASREDVQNGFKYTKYNGVHDSSVHGASKDANVVLDNNYVQGTVFELGHTKNIQIYDLKMCHMNGETHFIELDASANVKIYRNTFEDSQNQGDEKEAINIDVPDPNTGGFSGAYSSQDCTPNKNIYIYENTFQNVPVGIGTHLYTDVSPHSNISIYNNTFKNMFFYGITARNWSNFSIKNNTFTNVGTKTSDTLYGVGCVFMMAGVKNPVVTGNVISNADTLMRINVLYYTQTSGVNAELLKYAAVYNDISEENQALMLENTCTNVVRPWIYYRNEKTGDYTLWYKEDENLKDFYVDPSSTPFMEKYMSSSVYTESTRLYYTIRSYLEHLEEIGGGTLHIAAGTYPITNILYIPSNVTIEMEDGAVLKNANGSNIMLNCRSQSVVLDDAKDYAAAANIRISGGSIDTAGVNGCQPVFIAKANGVTLENVDFTGSYGYAARILSSKNVKISGCSFQGDSESRGIFMKNTYNSKPCVGVTVKGCSFKGLKQGIVAAAQTETEQQNISITNSSFSGCIQEAILMYKIQNAVISSNSFSDMTDSSSYGARLYGMNGLEMKNNQFSNMYNCASIYYNQNYGENIMTDAQKEQMRTTNVYDSKVVNAYISFRADAGSKTEMLSNN